MNKLILSALFLLSACSATPAKETDEESDQEKEERRIERMFHHETRGGRDYSIRLRSASIQHS